MGLKFLQNRYKKHKLNNLDIAGKMWNIVIIPLEVSHKKNLQSLLCKFVISNVYS